jgi:hypothetical protein
MPRAKPRQPRANVAHPLYRGHVGLWALVRRADDLSGRSAPGTLIGAGASWAPTSAEGPGLNCDGTAGYVNCGTASGVGGAGAMTVWARMILRTVKAANDYGGIVAQWNDGGAATVRQQFHLIHINGYGRPANSLDFTVNCSPAPGSMAQSVIQFQSGDLGRPWTVVGTYDGSTVRLLAFLPSGHVTASASRTDPINGSVQSATFLGNIDSLYCDQILLAAGVVRGRAWTAQEAARLHADPYALFRPAAATSVARAAVATDTTIYYAD